MNARDLPLAIAEIGDEARRLLQGHSHVYDVVVRYTDGTVDVSNLMRYLPHRDAHMKRVCEWLARSGRGGSIDRIELVASIAAGRMVYIYSPRYPGRHSVAVRP